jgi:hypothetical protein
MNLLAVAANSKPKRKRRKRLSPESSLLVSDVEFRELEYVPSPNFRHGV